MRRAAIPLTLASVLLAAAGSAQALGFGRVVNVSTLGQPLNFAATVRLDADESLGRECVAVDVQSGESHLPNAALRITVEAGRDAQERQIRVTTVAPIDEPVVTVNVTAGCVPRLSRSFVMLVDPPTVNLAQTETLPPQRNESQVAPVMAAAQAASVAQTPRAAAAASERAASATRPRAPRPAVAAAPQAGTVEPRAARPNRSAAAAAAPRTAPRPAAPGPRLRLEPPVASASPAASASRPGDAAVAAVAPASAAVLAAQAAASAASAAEAAQRRVAALEDSLATLRRTNDATQKALLELQLRLKEAENARYANPLIYALAMLAALLSVAVALLWWRQSHPRGASQWWLSPAPGAARAPLPRVPPEMASGSAKLETAPAVMDEIARSSFMDLPPPPPQRPAPPAPAPVVLPAAPIPQAPPPLVGEVPVLRRELSVEELIDLEQQADFFVVLGQDEAAIDLLMGHVRSTGGISPLPYLKLLEIYRRRGEHDSYERVRERFNRRFNAYAPDWDADLQQGKALDDYPAMLVKLQRFWDESSRVTALLDESLMRQGEDGENFDLPAYRELLFLYSIARDLTEHPAAEGSIDLLLPLELETPEAPIEHLSASRLMGFAPTDQFEIQVDLDVTQPAPPDEPKSDFLGLVGEPKKTGRGER